MRSRSSVITIYLCLLSLLVCGLGELFFVDRDARPSQTENRMLSAFPAWGAQEILSGRFMDGFENFLSDAFFFRDGAAAFSDGAAALFSLPSDEPDTGEIDADRLFAPTAAAAPEGSADPATEEPSAAADTTGAGSAALTLPERDGSFWLVNAEGDRRILSTYPAEALASFAGLLNEYRAQLPADGRLCFVSPPVTAVANNVIDSPAYTDWGCDVDELLQPLVSEGVEIYDATDILRPYMGTARLYPTQDHHWHPLAASLVAGDMLSSQDVPPVDYYEYRYYVSSISNFATFDREGLAAQRYSREATEIMRPNAPTECCLLTHLTQRRPSVFVEPPLGGLAAYLGGLNGPWRVIDTQYQTGRSALVIGDSFILTFTPFLTPYYDQILVTDLRENCYSTFLSGASIAEYIDYYGIDDIYILYSTYSNFCDELIQGPLRQHLYE